MLDVELNARSSWSRNGKACGLEEACVAYLSKQLTLLGKQLTLLPAGLEKVIDSFINFLNSFIYACRRR